MYYKGGDILDYYEIEYYEIGRRIKHYRKIRNYSQETLAEKVNISSSHMSHIETGITKLSLPVLVNISKALDISIDDLLFDKASIADPDKVTKFCKELSLCSSEQIDAVLEVSYATINTVKKYL